MKEGWYCEHKLCLYSDNCDEPRFLEENCQCINVRRKCETPEQFKERTGRDWPDDGAVYYQRIKNGVIVYPYGEKWSAKTYKDAKEFQRSEPDSTVNIICANTDFGCPPKGDFEEIN